MGSTYVPCPCCDRKTRHLLDHIRDEHPLVWQAQLNAAHQAFNDLTFNSKSDYSAYGLMVNRNDLYAMWNLLFTPAQLKARGNAARRVSNVKAGHVFYHKCSTTEMVRELLPGEQRCPICGKPVTRLLIHVYAEAYAGEVEHKEWLADQVEAAIRAFGNVDAVLDDATAFNAGFCKDVWQAVFGENDVTLRQNTVKGQKAIKAVQQPGGNKRGVVGYRHDIGHTAASTYEANVYRVLQFHGAADEVDYLREHHNVFSLEYNGETFNYRVDFQDVKGVFGKPGAYVEVKGYMDPHSRERILAFRQKYGEDSLIVVGKRLEIERYCSDVRVDVDYDELEQRYSQAILLWETSAQNLRSTPWLYTRPDDETADEN